MRSIAKKMIPSGIVSWFRKVRNNLNIAIAKICANSRFTSNIFYLVDSSFSREHQAVLRGRVAYRRSIYDIGSSCALLRRNIHRIEKGLIMQPRRKVFGEGFIEETVNCYKSAISTNEFSEGEKKWSTDVLDEYFSCVGSTPIIDRSRISYDLARRKLPDRLNTNSLVSAVDSKFKPYPYSSISKSCITVDELESLFIQRRSVRWFEEKAVPKELVQKAANLASLAPSACNRQPYRFLFCNKKEKAISIAKCAGGTSGFAENIPSIIAIVGDLSAYPKERDRHLIYIDGSLGAMQLMLALETLGLSSCSINWPEVERSERNIRKILDLKCYERVVMLLAVGYSKQDGLIPFSQKKIDDLILEDISS